MILTHLRYAFRLVRLRPGSSAAVVLTLALALAAGQILRGVLFGISPADPAALAGTVAALALVVAASTAGPIRRALRVAPMSILRQ